VGIQNWLTSPSFGWNGAPYFRALVNRPWFVGDAKAGMTRKYEGLTWVTIAKAGHMVFFCGID
jgi:carboxypeptidase C (cathepsin A)